MNGKNISLYFHIPFCTRKCHYCHFYIIPDKDSFKSSFLEGLSLEWNLQKHCVTEKKVVSVYFGGGTPALLGPSSIEKIIGWTRPFLDEDAEITLEANPENITEKLIADYAAAGVNRLSIGIQTFDDVLLEKLGRTHSSQKALDAVFQASSAGIKNISIDLMYDLPGQTFEMWQKTLEKVEKIPITHLSLYNLTIEPNTVFFKYRESITKEQPTQQTSLEMYLEAINVLRKLEIFQYEISAFAKEGFESLHNTGYWIGRPFLGLGPSAFSYWNGERFRNIAHLNKYCNYLKESKSPVDFSEKLPSSASVRELLAIHLRLLKGVDLDPFQKEHGSISDALWKELNKLISENFLKLNGTNLSLTEQGLLFYDNVASEII